VSHPSFFDRFMGRQSAGLLLFRRRAGRVEVLLVHPGGPFWRNRDSGAWSIPKGEFGENEDALTTAQREFQEETGLTASGNFVPLSPIKQRGGKTVHAWLVECDVDASQINSNTFSMEWPPRSGKFAEFAEIDRAEWFTLNLANEKILEAQRPLLAEAQSKLETTFS
jgi:predicted NUDIX family NTP pyrophosphohydrolase